MIAFAIIAQRLRRKCETPPGGGDVEPDHCFHPVVAAKAGTRAVASKGPEGAARAASCETPPAAAPREQGVILHRLKRRQRKSINHQ